ncbi:hypothetical protein Godav_009669 [Gossypium davidsonii]|uniref:CSC1-like protein n=1 Tax=Gossypium davidsonii TaxID=34287 RepID=A0A7J8SDY3_GOSDV|nr:hypothetical protein [Gossypium davidsonii]
MNLESLLASVGINIGLAMVILFLFSILKKQPSNAAIYYARPLSKRHPITFPPFSLRRFIPSFSWIARAFRVTEDEILQTNGLDALIVIRLFKFGINFFTVCSSVGLLILLPINFGGQPASSDSYRSMDSCTISNIKTGSNMLWVHFMCLWFISLYGLHLLYREYSEILVKRIQQVRNLRHRPDQFTTLVREIPVCGEHQARGCCVDHFFSKHHPYSYHSYKMLYDGKDIEDLSKQARYVHEKVQGLRKKCEGKKHGKESDECRDDLLKITGLEEKLEELCRKIRQLQSEDMLEGKELPVAFVTFKSRWGAAMAAQTQQHTNPLLWITEMAPEPSDVSWRNLSIQYKILPVYKIGVILAATLLTIFFAVPVTAVQGIAKFEKLKKWFPPAMAIEFIPGLSSVVTGYLPSAVLKGFIYIVPFAMLGMAKLGGSISKSKEEIKACNMVFYFLLGNVFFLSLISGSLLDEIGEYVSHPKNLPSHLAALVSSQWLWQLGEQFGATFLQIQDVYETVYDTCGTFWPFIHHYIIVAIILMQITMIGLFGLKSKPAASVSTIPLLLLTIMFNEYCKIRFLPAFRSHSIQNAVENDELDEKSSEMEHSFDKAIEEYLQPCLVPVSFTQSDSSLYQPLITSW